MLPRHFLLTAFCLLPLLAPLSATAASPQAGPNPKGKKGQTADSNATSGDLGTEFARLQNNANHNDPEALLQLGRAYLEGLIVAQDDAKAAACFKKSANGGNWKPMPSPACAT